MDLSIIVPCYNEVDNVDKIEVELLPVLEGLADTQSVELIFVDDGSTDGTLPTLQKRLRENSSCQNVEFKFEKHTTNLGLGAAIRTGLAASTGQIIVTTDSDGTYKFINIPDMINYLQDNIDIVTASPYHPQGEVVGVPRYRLILSQGSSMIYRILVDWKIHTYTCLFRVYRRQVIEDISFTSNGFLAGTELLVKAILKGYRVAEYPAVLYSRVYGASKAKLARTIWAHLRFQSEVLLYKLHLHQFGEKDIFGGTRWKGRKLSSMEGSKK